MMLNDGRDGVRTVPPKRRDQLMRERSGQSRLLRTAQFHVHNVEYNASQRRTLDPSEKVQQS